MTIPDQTQGIKLLVDLYDHLESGSALSVETASKITAAIRHSVGSGDPLDTSLGLHCPGRSNSLSSRIATVRRNSFIHDAIQAVRENGMTEWQGCQCLATKIKAFLSGNEWRSTRYQPAPPAAWPLWKRLLWWAKSTDLDLPSSPRQLRAIMLETAAFKPHEKPEKLLALKLYPAMQDDPISPDRKH